MPLVLEHVGDTDLEKSKNKKEKHKSKSKKKKRSRTLKDHVEHDDLAHHDQQKDGGASGDVMTSSVSAMESQTHDMTASEATSFKHESFGSSQTSSLNPASMPRERERSMNQTDLLLTIEHERRAMKKSLKKQAKKEKKLAKKARRESAPTMYRDSDGRPAPGPPAPSITSQSHAQPSGTSTSHTGRGASRGGDSSVVSDLTFDMDTHSVATSRVTQFHQDQPFETIAEESKNSGGTNDNGSGDDPNAWAVSTAAAFPTESEDRKMHAATLMQRPLSPEVGHDDAFHDAGFSPMPPTPDGDPKKKIGAATGYADDSNPSLFEDDLHISERERRMAAVKPQFSKSTESFPSPSQSQINAFEQSDRKKAPSPAQRRSNPFSTHDDNNGWTLPKRPSHASSSARKSSQQGSSSNNGGSSGANSADIDKWEMFGYDSAPSPMKSSTRESSDGNRAGGHGSVDSNSTLSTRKTHEDPVARKAAEAAGRRSALEQRYHQQAAEGKVGGMPPVGADPQSQQLLIMYLKAMGTDARSAEAIALTFSTQQKLAEQQGLLGDDDENTSVGASDIPLSQIYAIMDEGKALVDNEGGSKESELTPRSVATGSAQSAKAAEAASGSRSRPRSQASASRSSRDDMSMGSQSNAADRPSQDTPSRRPIRSRSRRRNEPSARSRSTSRDQRRNGRSRGRRSRPLWVRSTAPGAVAMTGRAFGAPERPEVEPTPSADQDGSNIPPLPPASDQSPHVVEATAVKENDVELPVVYAESHPISFVLLLKEKSVRRFLVIGLIIVSIVVITVSVLLVKGSSPSSSPTDPNSGESSESPSVAPTQMPTFLSDEILQAATAYSDPGDLARPGSPQRNAVGWMSTIDTFPLSVGGVEWGARYSMVVIYFATGGDNWTARAKWLDPTEHVCEWSATIFCANDVLLDRLIVQGIDLTNNNLVGTIPPEMQHFPHVQYMRFSKNALTGPLPAGLFKMPIIAVIDIETNQLSGTLPAEIGGVSTLSFMDFHSNNFTGTIPTELLNVTNVNYIDLSWNNFVGTISTEFGSLVKLVSLNLRGNDISGTLPDALGTLPKLDFLLMDYNKLTGTLPQWLVDRVTRQEITLAGNEFTGSMPTLSDESLSVILGLYTAGGPTAIVDEIRLKTLDISDNQLTGPVPSWLGLLQSVQSLEVGGNLFDGVFPLGDAEFNGTSYELWTNLEVLNISYNRFDAMELPEDIPESLNILDLCGNSYSGALPGSYCDHRNLEFLGLSENPINLPISSILTCTKDMDDLKELALEESGLSGRLTEVLVNDLQELELLDLANNDLTGTIPTELFEIATLKTVILSNNTFEGNLPTEIGQATNLVTFWFDRNDLIGSIPSELSKVTNLQSINQFGNTRMRGFVPEGVCDNIKNGPAKYIPNEHMDCTMECACCGPNRTEFCSGGVSNPRETSFVGQGSMGAPKDIFTGGGNRQRHLRSRNSLL